MTDIPIPDDLIDISFPIAVSLAGNVTDNLEASLVQLAAEHQITQAIMRDRAAQADRMARLEEFVAWVDTWVSQPVGAFSVSALDGIFAMSRDRIRALSQEGSEPS